MERTPLHAERAHTPCVNVHALAKGAILAQYAVPTARVSTQRLSHRARP